MKSPLYLIRRFRALFTRRALDADFDEELAQHLEAATADNIRAGMTPVEARRQARMALGGFDVARELHRDTRGLPWLENLVRDVRHGLRGMRRSPGFTLVAVLTLALGLTVNATVFSFVNELFLRPLVATNPDELVSITQKTPHFEMPFPFSYPDFRDLRSTIDGGEGKVDPDMARTYAGLIAFNDQPVHLSRPGGAVERTWVHVASNNYFDVLGVQPLHGRLFLPTEGQHPGADPIIVLTHDAWRARFAADPAIVGQQVKLNGLTFTVVGVTPPGFKGAAWGTALSGFVPATMLPAMTPGRAHLLFSRGDTAFFLMGRLRSGASLQQARAVTSVVIQRLIKEHPDSHAPEAFAQIMPESRSRPSPFVAGFVPLILSALMALAGLVLLVAVANVANLLHARAADRERELAIRGALGASRGRLLCQLLVESVLLALAAGVVGSIGSYWAGPLLSSFAPTEGMAPAANISTDWRPFVFTLVAALATGVFTGLLPALKVTRFNVLPFLKKGAQTSSQDRHPLRSLLVVGQVGVSCVVLVCAGLALRSLEKLTRVNLGFQPENLQLASFDLGMQRYSNEQCLQFQARLLESVRALPGVSAASLAEHAPFDVSGGLRGGIKPEGGTTSDDAIFQYIPCLPVEHGFLATAGVHLEGGRDFAISDDRSAPMVAVINRVLARHFWPDQNPVGKRIVIGNQITEVIGVIGEARFWAITDRARPLVFRPLAQINRTALTLVVRTEQDPASIGATLQRVVRQLDPDLPLFNLRTMESQIAHSPLGLMPLRMGAAIAGAQGAIALVLAALGVFGLVSFAVTRRTREIGIRMALGAGTGEVVRLVTRQSLKLTLIGLALGLPVAFALTRVLADLLYGVSPGDVAVLIGVAALVVIVTLFACWLPVRRALRVNPIDALRAE